MNLVPAILTDSFLTLQEQVEAVRSSNLIQNVQIDVIDGQFADNLTVTPLDLTVADFDPFKIDFHFMTEEPMDFVYECAGLREYLPIRQIIGQVERMSHQLDFLDEVTRNGWQPVLALDLYTPLEAIDEDVWSQLRAILIMTVEAGAQDQIFNTKALEKVREIRRVYPQTDRMKILVDGGVKLTNARQILASGADEIMVGSALWESRDPLTTIEEFYSIESRT